MACLFKSVRKTEEYSYGAWVLTAAAFLDTYGQGLTNQSKNWAETCLSFLVLNIFLCSTTKCSTGGAAVELHLYSSCRKTSLAAAHWRVCQHTRSTKIYCTAEFRITKTFTRALIGTARKIIPKYPILYFTQGKVQSSGQ